MAIHVDVSPKSLSNLREDARRQGYSVRDLASISLNELFNGDRSVFMFTPAMPQELLPKVQFVMDALMRDKDLFEEVQNLIMKRVGEKMEEAKNAAQEITANQA